jgi:hypothetical protein
MNESIYRKVGKKYVLVSDDEYISYLKNGFYLIHAYECGRSLQKVHPDKAAVKAAFEIAKDAMLDALIEASRMRPGDGVTPLSRKEKKAFAAYQKVMGKGSIARFHSESLHGIIEAGIKALEPYVKPSNTFPPF